MKARYVATLLFGFIVLPMFCSTNHLFDMEHDGMKNELVESHNALRKDEGSSNMQCLKWDDHLAVDAKELAEKCIFQHEIKGDQGQNIFVTTVDGPPSMHDVTHSWYNEKQDYTYAPVGQADCAAGKMCGHYTQVVWAETNLVGCAANQCDKIQGFGDPPSAGVIVICNYGPAGNYQNELPYKKGAACSECPAGKTCCDGLCCDQCPQTTTTSSTTTTATTTDPSATTSTTTSTSSTTTTTSTSTTTTSTSTTTTSTTTTTTTTSTTTTSTTTTSTTTTSTTTTSTTTTSTTTTSTTTTSTTTTSTTTTSTTTTSTTTTSTTTTSTSTTSTSASTTSTSFTTTSVTTTTSTSGTTVSTVSTTTGTTTTMDPLQHGQQPVSAAASPECTDPQHQIYCQMYAQTGNCLVPALQEMTANLCPLTCSTGCPPPQNQPAPQQPVAPQQNAMCPDLGTDLCVLWKALGWCTMPGIGAAAQVSCPGTCGLPCQAPQQPQQNPQYPSQQNPQHPPQQQPQQNSQYPPQQQPMQQPQQQHAPPTSFGHRPPTPGQLQQCPDFSATLCQMYAFLGWCTLPAQLLNAQHMCPQSCGVPGTCAAVAPQQLQPQPQQPPQQPVVPVNPSKPTTALSPPGGPPMRVRPKPGSQPAPAPVPQPPVAPQPTAEQIQFCNQVVMANLCPVLEMCRTCKPMCQQIAGIMC